MKHGSLYLVGALIALLCGCGHNVYMERESSGFGMLLPIGESAMGVSIGSMKTVSATVRGGVSLETTSSASGGLFSGSGAESKITSFKTNTQLNENNLANVFMSSNVPESVKMILASNLVEAAKAPKFMPAILQTDSATVHMGAESVQSNTVEQITPHSSGLDKVIETIPQITTPVVNAVSETTSNIVTNTIDTVKDTVNNTINKTINWAIVTKWTIIVASVSALAVALIKRSASISAPSPTPSLEEIDDEIKKESEPSSIATDSNGGGSQPKSNEPIAPAPKKKETPTNKPATNKKTWWQRLVAIVGAIITLIGKIPKETRAKILLNAKDWLSRKRTERAKKK